MFSKFLEELEQKEIEISFSDGKILYSGPEENITPAIISKLKEYKKDLIKYFWPDECKNMIPVNYEGSKPPYIFLECFDLSCLLSNYFGSDQPIYEFHNNTWSTGERSAHNRMQSLAKDYINQLKKVLPNGYYILGGHSFGGTLAYEMAIQLKKSGNEVPLIVLFDSNPCLYESINWHSNILHIFINILKRPVKKLYYLLRIFAFNSFFFLRKSLPKVLWRNYILTWYIFLLGKYRPEKFNGNILLFKARNVSSIYKYDYGWESLNSKVIIKEFEGDHISIFRKTENVEIMSKEIEKHLTDIRKIK